MSKKILNKEQELMQKIGYSQRAIALYHNKVNMGEMENPTIVTNFFGPCGDFIKLYLEIDKKRMIKDAKFYYLGCPASASCASAMTSLLKGKTIDQANRISEDHILEDLGGLPKSKHDCAKLSIRTLKKAITEYEILTDK